MYIYLSTESRKHKIPQNSEHGFSVIPCFSVSVAKIKRYPSLQIKRYEYLD